MKRIISTLCTLFVISLFSCAQEKANVVYKPKDLRIFSDYIQKLDAQKNENMGDLIVETGRFFSGKPYVASTLEVADREELVVDLTEFDCTTLLETCFALSLMLKDDDFDVEKGDAANFAVFCRKLKEIRYRNGEINGYASRLHYFSDWIFCNEKNGLVRDVTKAVGGVEMTADVNFMSTHPASYRQLKNDGLLVDAIKQTEAEINRRTYYYIPKSKISAVQSSIQEGDMIAFTTSIAGLDVSHLGFAVWENNELHLLHASLTEKKVLISTQPLSVYTKNVKRHTGIMVVRPL